jgi:hypothetical protein
VYKREIVDELNSLSKSILGSYSKWKKMVEKGVPELKEESTKKLTVKDGKQETETVKTPVFHTGKNGNCEMHQYYLHRYTVSEVKNFMLTIKDRRAQVQAAIKRIEEQQKAEAAAKAEAEKASGTAV